MTFYRRGTVYVGGRHLLADPSEEALGKQFKRDALILALVAGGLFLMGIAFTAVGVAAATGYISS